MRKSILACAACLALLTTSCGASLEQTANRNVTQTEVVLSKNNYRVVGMTSGESTQNYILCFGGLSKKSLGESAMAEMYKNANLKGAQAIINTNVCLKTSTYLGLYSKVNAIATGTIIEFSDSQSNAIATMQADGEVTSNQESIGNEILNQKPQNAIKQKDGDVSSKQASRKKENKKQKQKGPAKEYYTLTFYKKSKKSNAWEKVNEKTVHTTYEEAAKEADIWGMKSDSSSEYMCSIKKSKS